MVSDRWPNLTALVDSTVRDVAASTVWWGRLSALVLVVPGFLVLVVVPVAVVVGGCAVVGVEPPPSAEEEYGTESDEAEEHVRHLSTVEAPGSRPPSVVRPGVTGARGIWRHLGSPDRAVVITDWCVYGRGIATLGDPP